MKFIAILLSGTLCLTMFAGGGFAPEWNFAGRAADKGKTAKITEHYRAGDVVHVFDVSGRKILRTYPDIKSRQKIEMKMFYNADGKLEKIECFADGKLVYIEKGSYADGLLRYLERTDAKGRELCWTTMMNYDKRSKLISFGVQEPGSRVDYFYDRNQKGDLVFVRACVGKDIKSAAKYIYNAHGSITEIRSFSGNMKNSGILFNEWKYDKNGNWIEKKSFYQKNAKSVIVPLEVVKRSIQYRN